MDDSKSLCLLGRLLLERREHIHGSVYSYLQVKFAYESNGIEGNKLTMDKVFSLYDNVPIMEGPVTRNDLIEISNHFMAFDYVLDASDSPLTQTFIKDLHRLLRQSTIDQYEMGYQVGEYKSLPNVVGNTETVPPEDVLARMEELLQWYLSKDSPSFEDIVEFHARFEKIHPFQDGNGRVGRLIAFRECLKHDHIPFIINMEDREFYHRGLREWPRDHNYLVDTCHSAQDDMILVLDHYSISYPPL